jgi:Flp pilus assembly protein TadB
MPHVVISFSAARHRQETRSDLRIEPQSTDPVTFSERAAGERNMDGGRVRTVAAHAALAIGIVAGGAVLVIFALLLAMVLAPVGAALLTYVVWRSGVAARRRVRLRLVRDPEPVPAAIRAR